MPASLCGVSIADRSRLVASSKAAQLLQIASVRVFPLAIPMRLKFEHAAASRNVADPVVIELSAAPPFSGITGWGETLARAYVTGETTESVIATIRDRFADLLSGFRASNFEEAVSLAQRLPFEFDGNRAQAARCAVELAWLDLAGRVFRRPLRDAALCALPQLRNMPRPSPPRYSGIVVGRGSAKLKLFIRAQTAYGLRDFKIKVAVPDWQRRLHAAHAVLRRSITQGRATLRVDANGGWTPAEALEAIPLLHACQVAAIEQPFPVSMDAHLSEIAAATQIPLMPDESLISQQDADRLIKLGARMLNVRIAKVGGLIPALRMALSAAEKNCAVQLGCLVGETSILAAAGQSLIDIYPAIRFLEGAFGKWLLKRDIAVHPVQFGYGGRVSRRLGDFGLGIEINDASVLQLSSIASPISISL